MTLGLPARCTTEVHSTRFAACNALYRFDHHAQIRTKRGPCLTRKRQQTVLPAHAPPLFNHAQALDVTVPSVKKLLCGASKSWH